MHQLLGRHFTSNPCRQPGTVERCLQHTVGQRNQPSFSWGQKRSPLFWKGEILDMPGTCRLVQCAQTIGRSWVSFWKGILEEYFVDKSLLTIRAELQPYPVRRASRNMYCTITEQRNLSAMVGLQTAGSCREAATRGFPLPASSK